MKLTKYEKLAASVFVCGIITLLLAVRSGMASFEERTPYYQCVTVAPPYSYNLSGRTDRVVGYLVNIDNPDDLNNPGLVFLAGDIMDKDEAYLTVNNHRYEVPWFIKSVTTSSEQVMENSTLYAIENPHDILFGKVVVPIKPEHLNPGINEITFYMGDYSDGYSIFDSRVESVDHTSAEVVKISYDTFTRYKAPSIDDFDFILDYQSEELRKESEAPNWIQRGKIRFYRAGTDWDNLDRMFEMFDEARITKASVGVRAGMSSEQYARTKAFIDRCHDEGIKVMAFLRALRGISLREVIENPDLKDFILRDEYGELVWRSRGNSYYCDLTNEKYIDMKLEEAKLAIDIGVDELYYDFGIGGSGEIQNFYSRVRDLAEERGRNISIFGNNKGNIIADDVTDITKTESTIEAGVFDGNWYHNVAQYRFYYAIGHGWKPNETKYEGANPGDAHPGAHDIRDGFKYGWKRPIAEAAAFHSFFCIAEAGSELLNGWVNQDNELAMEIWDNIVTYYQFLAEYEDVYTDVRSLSKVGLVVPPVVPSAEMSMTRSLLYDAMVESNIMYDILLLSRLNKDDLAKYPVIVIPDIPFMDKEALNTIDEYKRNGGNVYTIGSINELSEFADVYSPGSILQSVKRGTPQMNEIVRNIHGLSGGPLISLDDSEHIIVNVSRKAETDQIILHFINYSDDIKENLRVKVNLEGLVNHIDRDSITLLSPDSIPKTFEELSVQDHTMEFSIPELQTYNVVLIN
ncbi:MAG: hypothetical protein WD097_04730 [Balneolales bacterium]